MTTGEILLVVRLILVAGVLVVLWLQRCRGQKLLFQVPLIVWMIHAAIFSVVYLIDKQDADVHAASYNIWSSAVSIHGYFTMFIVEVARWVRQKEQKHGC